MKPPPAALVCLTSLPRETWLGTTVYHPMSQRGGVPYWRELDAPPLYPGEERSEAYRYDVGVVDSVAPDPLGGWRCRFRTRGGGTLVYGAYNLWVEQTGA